MIPKLGARAGGLVLAISAVAGAVVTVDKIGGNPIAPGVDSKLAWAVDGAHFTITSDLPGDNLCMLRFWFADSDSVHVHLPSPSR